MNIAAYCRVSTDKEDQLNSLEAQKEFFAEYTKRTGDNLVRLYADEGISGTKIKNRREFLRMMADAELGCFELVVVKDISRFARNTVDLLQNVRRLKALGIETQFLTANMTNMGNSEFVLTIFGALAQEESANTSKRIKFGKRLNAEKGRVPNLVFGYDKTPGEYFHLRVNEREAAAVRDVFRWYVKEGIGAAKISILLNERHIRTKRGCAWSANAVCRILTNPLYTGRVVNGRQEVEDFLTGRRRDRAKDDWLVSERPELRIVEPAAFAEAQRLLAARGQAFRLHGERHSNRHLFSTLIRCKECGWSFRRSSRTFRNTYVRWVCSGRSGRGADSCANRTAVDEDELIETLQEYFADLLRCKKQVVRRAVAEFERGCRAKEENRSQRKELSAELSRLRGARRRLLDLYADDVMTREELTERMGGLRGRIDTLERQLQSLSGRFDSAEKLEEVLSATFRRIEDVADVAAMSNAQLKRIVEKIEVDQEGNVDIYLRLVGEPNGEKTVPIRYDRT